MALKDTVLYLDQLVAGILQEAGTTTLKDYSTSTK